MLVKRDIVMGLGTRGFILENFGVLDDDDDDDCSFQVDVCHERK